jgi:translation initiation factor IF-2
MSEEKIRVKDITAELGVSSKDMLTALREFNIPTKSLMTTLSSEDAARVRERFAGTGSDEDKVHRETQSGVIVRRRRRDEDGSPEPKKAAKAAPSKVEAVKEAAKEPGAEDQSAEKTVAKKKAAKTEETSPAEASAPSKAEQTPAAKEEEKAAPAKTAKVVKAPEQKARIIRRADEEAPKQEKSAKEAAPKEEAASATPTEAPQAEKKTAAKTQRQTKANISAEPERGTDGSAVSSVPVLAARPERTEDETGTDSPAYAPSSQVRIISRPDPNQQRQARPTARPAPHSGDSRGGDSRGGDPRGGDSRSGDSRPGGYRSGPRPGGSGGPGGANGGRPFSPRPPMPMPGQAPDPIFTEASKKKRTKGRRTVEFDFTGGDEFNKRRKEMDSDDEGVWRGKNKKCKGRDGKRTSTVTQPIKAAKRKIRVDEFIRVSDLAHQMGLKTTEIIIILFNLGVMTTINQTLDVDTATLVAAEFDYEVEKVGFSEEKFLEQQQAPDSEENLKPRPPVVTIMGHVDHGKTSLLDAIRKSSVVSGEAGGITQHIGAYNVKTKKGQIVFLDTPGHEAFTAMRARGAKITDIVVLVVAADDGVMEQTREAISHAKAAGVPIMVAVNKMDKEEANPDSVKRELAEQGLVPEDWGGDVLFSYVSAKSRMGVDDLLELIALQAEIMELKANPDKPARGHIIEAKLDKGRGSLGTVLIQEGTLNVGDTFVCGVHFGRVRAMFDDKSKKVKSAGPSVPVEVQGFEGVPEAGEEFICITDEKAARRIAETRGIKHREKALAKESRVTLETFLSRKPDAVKALVLNVVVKADVQGSLEAITDALAKLSTEKVRIQAIHTGAGAISESDVLLASASDSIIIGFNVRPTPKAKELIEQEKIDIRFYDIIYKLVEEVKSAMEGMLAPVEKEVYLGLAEIRETFSVPKVGVIAGCHVSDGKITRNAQVRLLRDNVVIYTGKISSLKRFKDDAKEVLKGYECGIGLERFNDLKVGDSIEVFEMVEEVAQL